MKLRRIALILITTFFTLIFTTLTFLEYGTSLNTSKNIKYLGPDDKPFGQFTNTAKIPIWDRENTFINYNLFSRQGLGPELISLDESNQAIPDSSPTQKPIKLLLIGDSFIWGDGISNINNSLGVALQDKLDSLTKPGLFHVILFAQTGASTFTYLDLLEDRYIKNLKPDKIVYAYYTNDSIPNFNESIICQSKINRCEQFSPATTPIYQDCANGKSGLIPSLTRTLLRPLYPAISEKILINYCEPILKKLKEQTYDDQYLWDHPWANPWINTWKEALKLLRAKAPTTKFYISQLYFTPINPPADKFIHTAFPASGFTDIPMTETKATLAKHFTSDLRLNEVNNHANFILVTAYASDIANNLIKDLDLPITDFSTDSKFLKRYNLLSTTLPSNLKITDSTPTSFNVNFKLDKTHFFPHKVSGKEAGHQFVSCALLGYPYLQFNLSRYTPSGTLTLNSSNPDLYPYLITYDKDGKRLITPFTQPISLNNKIELPPARSYELLLADKSRVGCPIDQDITFPDLTLSATFLPSS